MTRLARSLYPAPWRYSFDWYPSGSPWRACHCLELPFVLGTDTAWAAAPMLGGGRPPALVAEVRGHWIDFIRHGDPGWAAGTTHHFTR
ncbi:hypothetical protein [Nocardia panacis]|uniref:hypothetical protein n=1 Tax=Nocardia panacis TaxID=2340916 RepID=UPI001EEFD92A|nr:hypothetical protein [Nocardia panacis]